MSKNNLFDSLIHDLDRTKKKQRACKKNINENITNVMQLLQNTLNEIKNDNNIGEDDDLQLRTKIEELSTAVSNQKPLPKILKSHKEYFAYISKSGKDIDKAFNKDINYIFNTTKPDQTLVNNVIDENYLREGNFEIHELLKKELELQGNPEAEKSFQYIHSILDECKKGNIEPALEWALTHEKKLEEIESDILFRLYQQKFLQVLDSKGKEHAIKFARENFGKLFPKYAPEIQRLMGSLMFDKASQQSRYSDLFDSKRWEVLAAEIAHCACKIHKTTPDSPLYTVLSAGTLVMPKLLKYYTLSAIQNKPKWKFNTEIPVATDLGKDYQFHSIFVCPVSKEISTPDNPPIMLKCGHVISELSLKKLALINRTKFKCPYCPTEQSLSSAKRIFFN